MRKLIIIMGILAVFLTADTFIAWHLHPDARTPLEALKKSEGELAAQVLVRSMKMRMTLPQKVDDTTELEDISADRSTVTYKLSIDADPVEFIHVMREITAHMRETGCDRADYRRLLGFGLTIVLNIHSRDGVPGAPIVFTPHVCGLDK